GTDEGGRRQAAFGARHHERDVQTGRAAARDHRLAAARLTSGRTDMTKRSFRGLRAAAALLAFALALAGMTAPTRAADAQVMIDNFTFNPPRLTVKAGTT